MMIQVAAGAAALYFVVAVCLRLIVMRRGWRVLRGMDRHYARRTVR